MQELAWLAEPLRIWIEGGSWAEIKGSPGFQAIVLLAATLIPSSIIAVGISGWSDWRETPLALWFGFGPSQTNEDWTERARDLDKDGTPDF